MDQHAAKAIFFHAALSIGLALPRDLGYMLIRDRITICHQDLHHLRHEYVRLATFVHLRYWMLS